jgi:hypothetical protein
VLLPRDYQALGKELPVIRNMGPLVLRMDLNVLLGVKYLF